MTNNRDSSGRQKMDATRKRIERMEAEREERRRQFQEKKQERAKEEMRNLAAGNPGDVDFIGLVRAWRKEHTGGEEVDDDEQELEEDDNQNDFRICIAVRKRPLNDKERTKLDHDSITCVRPNQVWVHHAKLKVDGITKYLDHHSFTLDYSFNENTTTTQLYHLTTKPLVDFVCNHNNNNTKTTQQQPSSATVFAYGQTGSGKTYTMEGIQELVARDLFRQIDSTTTTVSVAFFEIYGVYVQDLLHNRKKLKVLEDGKGAIVVTGLEEFEANDPSQFHALVAKGNEMRTTHSTEANDTSSRSHAICQIRLRSKLGNKKLLRGKLSLVDLAGSERGSDTKSHNSQRRTESAEINTSLLALKECIRALDKGSNKQQHVPYRASKLTLLLKDCFTSSRAKTTMIATVSPGASSVDHTLNTLRYADRIKEKKTTTTTTTTALAKKGKRQTGAKPKANRKANTKSVVQPRQQETKEEEEEEEEEPLLLDEETELRQTVQELFSQEEDLLNTHMNNIQENAELLTEEGKMLQTVAADGVTEQEIAEYANRLEAIIERKCQMIELLQDRMVAFRKNLKREEELSQRVGNLTQY